MAQRSLITWSSSKVSAAFLISHFSSSWSQPMKVGDLVRKRLPTLHKGLGIIVQTRRDNTIVSVKWLDTGRVLRCTHRSLLLVQAS
tara:strand:- start:108 stop:365 length:258 start_codon:yes stop_codon:yes gene_type:complete